MKKKNEVQEMREVYIECMTPGSVNDIVYKGYMKKADECADEDETYTLYKGYLKDRVFDDCICFCIKYRKNAETVERSKYYIFPKSTMKNPTCVVLKRDMRNGNIENYGEWGSVDFYGIDNSLCFDAHGEVYSYDVLTKEKDQTVADKFFSEQEAEFSKILADDRKNAKYNQFLIHYEQGIFKTNGLNA